MTERAPASTTVRAVDYHTGGEPFRIVVGGAPELEGRTVLERRRWARANVDHVRRLLVHEPRGHADMYGCFVTPPDDDGADLGVVFFHNEGYSTACGHGTIALATWAIDEGRALADGRRATVVVDVPSGRVECRGSLDEAGRVISVAFRNVPSFVLAREVEIETGRGLVHVDVSFGGAFYGSVEIGSVGLAVDRASLPSLIALQRELRPALDARLDPRHPDEPELAGIYGIIFWGAEPAEEGAALVQRNVTVFADGEVDRSPCGSGTSARLALLDAAAGGPLERGATLVHRSIVDSVFTARVVGDGPTVGGEASVITEVEGSAYRTGSHAFELDPRDPLGTGFLLR
ncbi:MAG TPA: proline racemase family protein [Candidatus Limnocylindrales bacterium]|nr:proline racemase family protein [Candidatus Limnocylindrales bacterium]